MKAEEFMQDTFEKASTMQELLDSVLLPFRRMILPHNDELDETLAQAVANGGNPDLIVRRLVGSAAFRRTYPKVFDGIHLGYRPRPIALDLDPEVLARLLERTRSHWETLGRTRPFWSVVSAPAFQKEDPTNAEQRAAFYRTGEVEVANLMAVLDRAGLSLPFASAMEFGCGLGRMTEPLARRFGRVLALDVSQPHLESAEAHCAGLAIGQLFFRNRFFNELRTL